MGSSICMASGFLCWICSICNNMFKNSRTLRLGGTAPRQVDSAQTKKRPQFRRTGGVMLRYKGLPECLSICELCVYCSSCTCTLSHLRELQGMWQTAGSQNLIPAVLDCSLCCSTQKREIKLPFLFPILYVPDSIFHCVHPMWSL